MTSIIKVDQIQNTSGTTGLSIDGSGFVAPKVPLFQVVLTSDQTVTSNVVTKVDWSAHGTVTVDNTSAWDSSNERWVPQTAGWYSVSGQLGFGTGTVQAGIVRVYKNSDIVSQQSSYMTSNSADDLATSTTSLIYLNGSTDYIELHGLARDASASTDVFFGSNGQCLFGAHLVSTA